MARRLWAVAANAVLLPSLLPIVVSQSISLLPSSASDSFPKCGLSCPLLNQAQDGCVPPAAPTYVSCFCESSLLTTLHSTGNGVCDDSCQSASDRALLKKWYNNYCSSGGEVHKATSGDKTSQTKGSETTTSTASASSAASNDTSSGAPPSWWSTHYQWVIMLIVLAVAFTAIAIGGIYLKRRHDAKYPGLYHGAAGNGSGSTGALFSRAQGVSPGPGVSSSNQVLPPARRFEHVKSDSIPSEMAAPREDGPRTRTPSRLQRSPRPPESDDLEIREAPR